MRLTFRSACVRAAFLALLLLLGIASGARAHDGAGAHDHANASMGAGAGLLSPTIGGLSNQTPLQKLSVAQAAAEPAHVLVFTETAAFRHGDAITNGTPKLRAAFEAAGITSEHTEDSSIFNDADLERFDALVMFQTSGDPWTASEKAAMERYQRAGGGIVAIHNATDMRGDYAWWDNLIGAKMPGHAATDGPGPEFGLPAEVIVEDDVHPSTDHLDDRRWARADEWYNFDRNVRGDAHVLLSMDESTYDAGGNRMGYDHPISWCKPYDGGRVWVTAMGHFAQHFDEPKLLAHIVGGVQYAAGNEPGECGASRWQDYERVTLDSNTNAPFELDVAPDGRVFYTELALGELRVWDPETSRTSVALQRDVYTGGEDGMLGLALDPDFAQNNYVYIYYSPASSDDKNPANWINRLSRFTLDGNTVDPASERKILDVPAHRDPVSEPGHTGGAVEFDLDGNLLLSVGDDTRPFESDGRTPIDEREGRVLWDAQRTSGNTNDLRGKILRITPDRDADGGYTIPAGNLFAPGTMGTRPEIYAMGFRNPFRFKVDPKTGWIAVADYGPDTGSDDPNRGPRGYVEWTILKEPGNQGWPYCHGPNLPYRDYNFATGQSGPEFNCAAPVNDSPNNTGLRQLPPVAAPPQVWYSYNASAQFPALGSGGAAPMAGPIYRYDPELESDTKFPASLDGTAFFMEWARNYVKTFHLNEEGELLKINPFLPNEAFLSPMDAEFGPDGSLYMLDWGGGYGRDNDLSSLYRIDYTQGDRSPMARASATPDAGAAPLQVQFTSAGSRDPEGAQLTYRWTFGDGTSSTEANPTHTYMQNGEYNAQLTITDAGGKSGTANVAIVVGNTRPQLNVKSPPNGSFFEFGDTLSWDMSVTDAEDGSTPNGVNCDQIVVQPSLGHDTHAHYESQFRGCTGSVNTGFGGHEAEANLSYVLNAEYTDKGAGGVRPLTARQVVILHPKRMQAEHFTSSSGVDRVASDDAEGGGQALVGLGAGDWIAFDPVNFTGINSIDLRVASSSAGGAVQLRSGSPEGPVLATAQVPDTGGVSRWADVRIDAPATEETVALYLVFTGEAGFRMNFLEANGKGISPVARPEVTLTSPTANQAFVPGMNTLTADVTDAENAITKVEFFVNGQSVGTDTSAPYSVDWTETDEDYYTAYAVATNDKGLTRQSRTVSFTVGEIGVRPPWQTFASIPNAEFNQLGDTFRISAAGNDVWQGTNEYGSIFLPGDGGENFVATVRVASFDGTHGASKAGIIVRNDITQAGSSKGYLVLGEKGNGEAEFLHDAGGNGQVNNGGEPVATACPGDNQPTWLRVKKEGTAFTAYCSKNGTTWTQVGVTTQIPSATTAQDVGLFVVSHIGGTNATAEFTDWSLVTPDDPEEPEEPEEPGCTGTYSDEFNGAFSTSRWTTVRGTPTTADGSLVLPVTNGDINEATTGAISYAGQAVPAGDWVMETKFDIDHDNEWQHAALAQLVDNDNYIKLAYTQNTGGDRFLEYQTETNGGRTWHANGITMPATAGNTMYLRLSRTGSTLKAAYSLNGTTWTALPGEATLKAGGSIGVFAGGDTDAQNVNAEFDYLRVTPDCELDTTAPSTTATTTPAQPDGMGGWFKRAVELRLATEAGATTEYRVGAGAFQAYSGMVALSNDGTHVVTYRSKDAAGNIESEKSVTVKVDRTKPTSTATMDPAQPGPSGSYTGPVGVTLTGGDAAGGAGLDMVQYRLDGGEWRTYDGRVTVSERGDHTLEHRAMDKAGNVGDTGRETFSIQGAPTGGDNVAPTVRASVDRPAGNAPHAVRFSATASDPDGSEQELTYAWDFGDGSAVVRTRQAEHTYREPGTYEAKVTVTDADGSTATDSVRVTATRAPVDAPPNGGPPAGPPTNTPPVTRPPAGKVVVTPRISRRSVRVSRSGRASIRLRCPVSAGSSCEGILTMTRGTGRIRMDHGRLLSRRSFTMRGNRFGTVSLRMSEDGFARLKRSRKLGVTVVLLTRGADGELRRVAERLTLRAPKRSKR